MLKVVTIACLCTLLLCCAGGVSGAESTTDACLVEAQHDPTGGGPPDHRLSEQLNRSTRQAPPGGSGPIPQGMNGGMGPGNLGMQGLGNIPDPTVWITKGQEIASQFARGRRRRQIPNPKIPDGFPMPPMPKMIH